MLMLDILIPALVAQRDVRLSAEGWTRGLPLDETAFMNRITERLLRRKICAFHSPHPVLVRSQIYNLHKAGPRQTDKWGSDLAVTVWHGGRQQLKTVLFQLKRSKLAKVESLPRRQLDDALTYPEIGKRSYVAAVDNHLRRVGIESARVLRKQYKVIGSAAQEQKTKTFDLLQWADSGRWIYKWLSCSEGPVSAPGALQSIEAILGAHTSIRPSYYSWLNIDQPDMNALISDMPIIPTRYWLVLELDVAG